MECMNQFHNVMMQAEEQKGGAQLYTAPLLALYSTITGLLASIKKTYPLIYLLHHGIYSPGSGVVIVVLNMEAVRPT